jgi:uncharacterized protein YfbU (UPF0304 family)
MNLFKKIASELNKYATSVIDESTMAAWLRIEEVIIKTNNLYLIPFAKNQDKLSEQEKSKILNNVNEMYIKLQLPLKNLRESVINNKYDIFDLVSKTDAVFSRLRQDKYFLDKIPILEPTLSVLDDIKRISVINKNK